MYVMTYFIQALHDMASAGLHSANTACIVYCLACNLLARHVHPQLAQHDAAVLCVGSLVQNLELPCLNAAGYVQKGGH